MNEHYSPELVTLMETFNHMLSDIEMHEAELLKHYRQQEEAREVAESANMAKTQFLASISHELRTPLNAIIGFSTIINSQLFGDINEKYLEYSRDIHNSGVHLLEVINDILDLSKAESGELELQPSTFSLSQVIEKCTRILHKIADEHEIRFELDVAPDMPDIVADRVRVTQIVLNLLSNAVKFSHSTSVVHVRCRVRNDEAGEPLFCVDVADKGIGMTKVEIQTALQSFGQIDNGLNRRYEGTGLGLPLTRKLIELHKGSIYIESSPGEGTTVHVMLPSQPLVS
jgi:signal transduction histidine kinase